MTDYHTRANALYSYSVPDYRLKDGKHALKQPYAIAVVLVAFLFLYTDKL